MKRNLIAIILVLSLVICLPSCFEKKIEENPEFARFNEMFATGFENYTITVSSTSESGYTVKNEYTVSTVNGERSVSYKIETLNKFTVEGDLIEIPKEYVSVQQGTFNADQSASESFNVPKFNFSYKCIESDIITPKTFSADITSLADFAGISDTASSAEFSLEYSDNSPASMQISYVNGDNVTVVITYTFN